MCDDHIVIMQFFYFVCRVYKKSAQNNKITLYLGTRDLIISNKSIDKIQGVVYVDPDYLQDKKVYNFIILSFHI